jgi:hypothetical protein
VEGGLERTFSAHQGDCITPVELGPAGEGFLELLGAQRLSNPGEQCGLSWPQHWPGAHSSSTTQTICGTQGQRRVLRLSFRQSEP